MISNYREWRARSPTRMVHCHWEQIVTSEADDIGYLQRVLPDGCADVVVTASGEGVVVGPATSVALAHLRPGTIVRGMRFRTATVALALGAPASEFCDRTVPLDSVFASGKSAQTIEAIWAGETPGWATLGAADLRICRAVDKLWHSPGAEIAAVANSVGLSGRQLRRLLLSQTGLGPKTLQRIGRLHCFLRLAEAVPPFRDPAGSSVLATTGDVGSAGTAGASRGAATPRPGGLADLAAATGYADQAHLTREVRDLAGTTPARLLAERVATATTASATAATATAGPSSAERVSPSIADAESH